MSDIGGLAGERPGVGSKLAAGSLAAVIVIVTLLILPSAKLQLPEVKPFLPMFAVTVFITEYLTGYLLYTHFRVLREPFLACLAGAYFFVAVMVAVQILIFPGVFSDTGLFGAGPQSAVWLWTMWHGGFPAIVALALVLRIPFVRNNAILRLPGVGNGALLMIHAPILAALLAYLAVANGGVLPPLIDGTSYQQLVQSPAAPIVIALGASALIACLAISRLRDLLSLWLAVALVAGLADVVLTLAASSRYSLGWYAGRCMNMLSSSLVLATLLWETTGLYRRLAQVHAALAESSLHDALTGAFNRGYFMQQFPRDIRHSLRARTPLAMLMIDIDRFKNYNDSYGHLQGDHCLKAVTDAMQEEIHRPGDYLARYGGEEFAVVLPNTDAEGATHTAENLRKAVEALAIKNSHSGTVLITVSVGVSVFNPDVDAGTVEEIVGRADTALYAAKNSGRNRVVAFSRLDAASAPSN
ncbi:MAG: sensor domain-containing diguanylate cyclase [Casimicrobium sp.]